jgi:hypothetical protein
LGKSDFSGFLAKNPQKLGESFTGSSEFERGNHPSETDPVSALKTTKQP